MLYRVDTGYFVECMKPELVFPDEEWLQQGAGICPRCNYIDRSRYPRPVDVVLADRPEGQTAALIETSGITIWRRDFVKIIEKHLDGFVLGKCLLADDTVLDDYVTCYGAKYIVVRGNRQSRYRICSACGTVASEVRPGPEYVLARDLTDAKVYQNAQCRFFLAEEVAWAYDFDNWGNDTAFVALKPISVRETPADGQHLPGDPP